MKLDPVRVANAAQRAEEYIEEAESLEAQALVLRTKARVMRIRWGLLPAPEWRVPGTPADVTDDTDSNPSDV